MWISALIAAVLTSTPVTLPAIEAQLDEGTSPQIEAERMLPEPGRAGWAPAHIRAARSRSCYLTPQTAHRALPHGPAPALAPRRALIAPAASKFRTTSGFRSASVSRRAILRIGTRAWRRQERR